MSKTVFYLQFVRVRPDNAVIKSKVGPFENVLDAQHHYREGYKAGAPQYTDARIGKQIVDDNDHMVINLG